MPHSHSTPAGVDGGSRTPPTTPRKAGKMLAVRVQMLDDTITMFQVQVIHNDFVKWFRYVKSSILHAFITSIIYLAMTIEKSIKCYIGLISHLTRSKLVIIVISLFNKRKALISSEISVFSAFKYNYKLLFVTIFIQQ